MRTLILLLLITICYAAYNILVKVSAQNVPSLTTAPILATIFLQSAALMVSILYVIYLTRQGVSLALPVKAYAWGAAAGLFIGTAEVLYFYLFRGFENEPSMAASTAIPFIVGGTIVIAVAVSTLILNETLNTGQWAGVALAFVGMIILALNST